MDLIWKQNGKLLKGEGHDSPLIFPVTFPLTMGESYTITLSSSSRYDGSYATLKDVKLYLAGDEDDLDTILNVWPNYGADKTPPRPELNGGIEISFNRGLSFVRLGYDKVTGIRRCFQDDPSTWMTLPGSCIVPGGQDGVLGLLDLATISVRFIVPSLADQFRIFNIRLEAAFDPV